MRKFWHQFIPLTRELPNFKLWHQFCLREIIIKCLRCNQSPSCFQISNFGTYFVNGTFQYIDFCFFHGVSSQNHLMVNLLWMIIEQFCQKMGPSILKSPTFVWNRSGMYPISFTPRHLKIWRRMVSGGIEFPIVLGSWSSAPEKN